MSMVADVLRERRRIRLVYMPKHGSWLNPIEIRFGTLTRRLLKRGGFSSREDLKRRILAFIEVFNQTLAKPFRWIYIGKPLIAWLIRLDGRYLCGDGISLFETVKYLTVGQ
jgi:hypothetical protein